MIRNYIKIAFRNMSRHKGFFFINIAGLAIGITCCFLILLFVLDELSYDQFHTKADRIYRVATDGKLTERSFRMALSPVPLAKAFVEEFPEVDNATRLLKAGEALLKYGDKQFYESKAFLADPEIFEVFDIPLVKGDSKTALKEPKSLVITESTARRFFGDEDPIGKTIVAEGREDVIVTAVAKDMPENSHFHFDMMGSLTAISGPRAEIWVQANVYSYILLKEGADPAALESKFPAIVEKYAGPQLAQALGLTFDKLRDSGQRYGFFLQPLTDIHLHSNLDYEIEPNGNMTLVYVFSLVALFILIIACINFMNLATARSATRAKEVGMRKVLGSTRRDLIVQFLTESIVISFFAALMGLAFVYLLLPAFNNLTNKALSMDLFVNWVTLPGFLGVVFLVGLIAGSYPAFYLASFQPARVLKGKIKVGGKNIWVRKGLVLLQFAISIALFFCTIVVYKQTHFARTFEPGIDKKNVLVVRRADILGNRVDAFKTELASHPDIEYASESMTIPSYPFGNTVFWKEGDNAEQSKLMWMLVAGLDYDKVMNLEIINGRFFSKEYSTDQLAVVLNESAVKELGFTEDPVGKRVILPRGEQYGNLELNVIGIIKDFHFESVHQEIRPLLIASFAPLPRPFVSMKVNPENKQAAVKHVEETWKKFVPDRPLEHFYLEDRFNDLYKGEEQTGEIFTTFSILAIFIGCLGLFGLASFTAERRTKEIGIRKVLGATTRNIFVMLSLDFTRLVVIANILALPVAYYAMHRWLQNFAYRVPIFAWIFIVSAFLAWLIALITVSYQALKAASLDPVRSLRYE